ncbi:hypothetical protein Btru_045483, partial [Bulinus truncatus]
KKYFKDLKFIIKEKGKKEERKEKNEKKSEKCAPLDICLYCGAKKVHCLCCRAKKVNKVHPEIEGEKATKEVVDNDVKLIVRLVGSVPDSYNQNTHFNNVRYFLLLLLELVIKKQCWLVIPEVNNKSIKTFLWKMNETYAKHKELMFAMDPGEKNLEAFIKDGKTHKTKECIIMCNGSQVGILDIEKYITIEKKPCLILQESGDISDIISTLQLQWLDSESMNENDIDKLEKRVKLEEIDKKDAGLIKKKVIFEEDKKDAGLTKINVKTGEIDKKYTGILKENQKQNIATKIKDKIQSQIKYTILDIGMKLTGQVIIHHILKCIVDEPENMENKDDNNIKKIKVNFLLLCVKLNQLDIADNKGGLWRIAFQDEDDRSESEKTTDSKMDSKTKKKNILCYALKLERYHFIRHLMQQGLCLENFLTIHDIHNPNLKNDDRDIEERIEICKFHHQVLYNKIKIYLKYYEKRFEETKMNIDLNLKEAPVEDNAKKEQTNSPEDLFIHSVLYEKFDVALLIWRTLEHPTHFALYAIEIINQMKSLIDPEHKDHIKMLNKNIMEFEQLAIDTVNNTYHKHRDQINNLLTYEDKNLRNTNCVMLAMKNNCAKFLSQPPCQELNQTIWRCGNLPVNDKKKGENEKLLIPGQDVRKILSPSILALFRCIGHIVFLVLFAMLLVSVLDVTTFHWIEWILWIWIFTYVFELFNQLRRNPMRWRRSNWSIFDYIEVAAIVLFILTWILRAVSYAYQEYPLMMVWTRVFFSVDYIMFCLWTLKFCCASRFLGPKLIIIITMSKVLVQFLLIILAFFTAFTVASQAVLYPNSEMNLLLTFKILKRPFWSVFGDFSLSDIDVDVSQCTTDPEIYNKYTQLRCPTESGSYYVPALMGVYVIIVNILLFNLLIALFNEEIKRDGNKSDEVWHHQTIVFTLENSKMIFLPPPFIVLCPMLWYLKGGESNSPFIPRETKSDEKTELEKIEAEQRDKVNVQKEIKYGSVIDPKNIDELSATVGTIYQDVLWIKYFVRIIKNLPKEKTFTHPKKEKTTKVSKPSKYA